MEGVRKPSELPGSRVHMDRHGHVVMYEYELQFSSHFYFTSMFTTVTFAVGCPLVSCP